jgi:ATP/maltotriose-dependent transcriptional regulator MalT
MIETVVPAPPLPSTQDAHWLDRAAGQAFVSASLYNGLGRYDDALAAAERAADREDDPGILFLLPELIEASVRSGRTGRAREALDSLLEITPSTGGNWALGIEARSRALLSEGDAAEELYKEAIHHLGRAASDLGLARTHLLYGEWLRRQRRRLDARWHLRVALRMFAAIGAQDFAKRARIELHATAEHARKRSVETRDDLTAQEAQVARLAGDGLSNPEIGAQLFISPSTVAYHLRKVYGKFGINSRHKLAHALGGAGDNPSV